MPGLMLLLVTLIPFTLPNGAKVCVAPSQIIWVAPGISGAPGSKTDIHTGNGDLYVRETLEDVARAIGLAK